jgi:hypothetical protein
MGRHPNRHIFPHDCIVNYIPGVGHFTFCWSNLKPWKRVRTWFRADIADSFPIEVPHDIGVFPDEPELDLLTALIVAPDAESAIELLIACELG